MAFGIPSFFKTAKVREFNYRPRYYSEEAERKAELEQRIREARGEVPPAERIAFSAQVREKWQGRRSARNTAGIAQRMRLASVLAALAALVWLFFHLA